MVSGDTTQWLQVRLMVIHPALGKVFLHINNGKESPLTVRIPAGRRLAEEVQNAVAQTWKLEVIVLDIRQLPSYPHWDAILEARSIETIKDRADLVAVGPDEVVPGPVRDAIREAIDQSFTGSARTGLSPFVKVGWVDEAQRWISSVLAARNVELTGKMRQLNAGGAFSLVRFEATSGPAYWMKASGGDNVREFAITTQLATLYPNFLPPLVASRSDWNAWVMEEVGRPLELSSPPNELNRLGYALAELQLSSVEHSQRLFTCGCSDQRLQKLNLNLPTIFQFLEIWLSEQPGSDEAMSINRFTELRQLVEQAIDSMDRLAFPDTIANNDFKLANVLSDGIRIVITDWCHAFVGNPFLTFGHLHSYLLKMDNKLASEFATGYSQVWRALYGEDRVRSAIEIARILSPYAYLYGDADHWYSPRTEDPQFRRACLRMLRHIDHACRNIDVREVLWN